MYKAQLSTIQRKAQLCHLSLVNTAWKMPCVMHEYLLRLTRDSCIHGDGTIELPV